MNYNFKNNKYNINLSYSNRKKNNLKKEFKNCNNRKIKLKKSSNK